MNVEVKTLPDYNVAYERHVGPYDSSSIGPTYDKLCAWAGPKGLILPSAKFIGISWDNPDVTPADECRYDACLTIPVDTSVGEEIGHTIIKGGSYAVLHCEITNSNFKDPWDKLFSEWLPKSGLQPDEKPCLEIYHSTSEQNAKGNFIVDLCLPVKTN
jgi:AraC family transcriptional regulator